MSLGRGVAEHLDEEQFKVKSLASGTDIFTNPLAMRATQSVCRSAHICGVPTSLIPYGYQRVKTILERKVNIFDVSVKPLLLVGGQQQDSHSLFALPNVSPIQG